MAGFEPLDILAAVTMLLRQIREGRCEVENQYKRVVPEHGNPAALALMAKVFALRPHFEWRGLGFISQSALRLHDDFAEFDAELQFAMPGVRVADPKACQCGEVLKGVLKPWECKFPHRMHPGDTDRDVHGVTRGSVRRLLQLRAHAPRRRQAGGAVRAG